MKPRLIAVSLAALVVAGTVLWFRASVREFEDQINNLEAFKAYGRCLHEFRERAGAYPKALGEIQACFHYVNVRAGNDWWGNPVKYESDGARYVLLSFGRGGKPDGLDPWRLREANDPSDAARLICGHPEADQAMSDLGFHRACFK
ncbi:MAG: hypothetical protein ABI584_11010 [Acidobacteriota bacterium]